MVRILFTEELLTNLSLLLSLSEFPFYLEVLIHADLSDDAHGYIGAGCRFRMRSHIKLHRRGERRDSTRKEHTMERIYDIIPSKISVAAMVVVLWVAMTLSTAFAG